MAETTKIQWCDHTFNPWRGCSKVSPGCAHCYADAQASRNPGVLGVWGPDGTRVVASEAMWSEPAKWDRAARKAGVRKRVFCASMADVFEDWDGPMSDSKGGRIVWPSNHRPSWRELGGDRAVTMDDIRQRLFGLICSTENLDWLVLTKRPAFASEWLTAHYRSGTLVSVDGGERPTYFRPLPNVWLGTSVEDQQRADERIPHLLAAPASVRFLSCEPLLGPVDLSRWAGRDGLHWSIIGGESGGHSRPCHREWVASLVRQCGAANMAVFVKQLGAAYSDATNGVAGKSLLIPAEALGLLSRRLEDPKGGDVKEWPESLRVREFPDAPARPTAPSPAPARPRPAPCGRPAPRPGGSCAP